MSGLVGFLVFISIVAGAYFYQQIPLPSASSESKELKKNDERVKIVDSEKVIPKSQELFNTTVADDSNRLTFTDEELRYLKSSPSSQTGEALHLIGEITPPTLNGKSMQASSIHLLRNTNNESRRFLISYALRGEEFLGAVQIISVIKKSHPNNKQHDKSADHFVSILQTVVFKNFDINVAVEEKGVLYLGGGTGDAPFKTPAVLEVIQLTADGLIPQKFDSLRLSLPSYTVTSIAVSAHDVYVAVGDKHGGVLVLSNLLQVKPRVMNYEELSHKFYPIDDVRDLAIDKKNLYAVKGTDAGLWVLPRDDKSSEGRLINLTGATIAESKSTIELTSKSILLALGDGGAVLVDRQTLQPHTVFAQQTHSKDTGLSVTNSASGSARRLFLADGEAGARVMKYSKKDKRFNQTARITFGDNKSVNDIKYFNGLVVMAVGTAGVKIAQLYRGPQEIIEEYRDYQEEKNDDSKDNKKSK